MKRLLLVFVVLLALLPGGALAENLRDTVESTLNALPLRDWQAAYDQAFPQGEDFSGLVLRLARGEAAVDGVSLLRTLSSRLLGALTASLWRMARLMAPAVFCGVLERLRGSFANVSV